MAKLSNRVAGSFFLIVALISAISAAQDSLSPQARSRAPLSGISPALLAKANAGDAASQKRLGLAYANGEGVPQNYQLAAAWIRKAADQGYASAQSDLGALYKEGQGVPQDNEQALAWSRKGAEQGDSNGQFTLGLLYAQGQGVPQDYAKAALWFHKSAGQGYPAAQTSLGLLYCLGQGVTRDYAQAAALFRKAAEHGNVQAQFSLGLLYKEGNGVSKDDRQAVIWFTKAAQQGNTEAQAYLDQQRTLIHDPGEARSSRYVPVTARGVSIVPGAIVCPNYDAVSEIFHEYTAHWEDVMEDAMTHGQSRLIRGEPNPAPDLKAYGCTLVPPGTLMMLETGNAVPLVTAKLPNGNNIKGVTLPAMFSENRKELDTGVAILDSHQSSANQQASKGSTPNPRIPEVSNPTVYKPDINKTPVDVSAGNPNPPTQPQGIAEIDQQAVALWDQKRYSDAIPLFNQACSSGQADSCYHLGLMYDFGQGFAQDLHRAAIYYSKSCDSGNGSACYHLGMLPQSQPGGCHSAGVALNLSRSCDIGIATSCSMVGFSYIHGCGVTKDQEKGRQFLVKGCSLGDNNACDGIK